jgi:hypothetical protein
VRAGGAHPSLGFVTAGGSVTGNAVAADFVVSDWGCADSADLDCPRDDHGR